MIKKVGDVVEIDGKKYEITFVSGANFSYREYLGEPEENPVKEEQKEEPEPPKRRSRRK